MLGQPIWFKSGLNFIKNSFSTFLRNLYFSKTSVQATPNGLDLGQVLVIWRKSTQDNILFMLSTFGERIFVPYLESRLYHFSQFGFISDRVNIGQDGADMYFHCSVKVCPIQDESTCSLSTVIFFWKSHLWIKTSHQITGEKSTCPVSSLPGPIRRKELNENFQQLDFTGSVIKGRFRSDVIVIKAYPKPISKAK